MCVDVIVYVLAAGRRDHDAASQVYTDRDGTCTDGAQPIQRATDGATGSRALDGDDPVSET